MVSLNLETIPIVLAVCRLAPSSAIPQWALVADFFSISKTSDELSIVCPQSNVPHDVKAEKNWRCLKVKGQLDFALTGILASIATPLAEAKISIFAISTFDTDYLMIKQQNFDRAITALTQAGHSVS
jgi:hypothetical protein